MGPNTMMPQTLSPIARSLKRIREYTREHAELHQAHHFVYDIRLTPTLSVKFMVMGPNPGEQAKNWELTNGRPSEESSEFNFFDGTGLSVPARKWRGNAKFFCGTDSVLLAEYFFWSSQTMAQFKERFGQFEKSPHLEFCAELNKSLI